VGLIGQLPRTNQTGPAEWPDVETNDERIRQEFDGNIDNANIKSNAGIDRSKLATATADDIASTAAEDLGLSQTGTVRRGAISIPTEQTTTSTAYTTLTTPDQVASVVLPADGLIFVMYRALWKLTGATSPANAAIFIGSNQLVRSNPNSAPSAGVTSGSLPTDGDNYGTVFTTAYARSLDRAASETSNSSLVTTGQHHGTPSGTSANEFPGWAAVPIEAAAGTYTISIKWNVDATGGTLSVKERKLWVWTMGF
jgi:hypothetical protein